MHSIVFWACEFSLLHSMFSLSQLAQLDDAKAVWSGSENLHEQLQYFVFHLSSFFFLAKRWFNWETFVSFSISRLCLFLSPYLCEEILPSEILFSYGILKTFPQHLFYFIFFGKTIFLLCAWIQKENWEGWRTDMKRVLSENWNKYLITFWKVFIFCVVAKVLMYMSIHFISFK